MVDPPMEPFHHLKILLVLRMCFIVETVDRAHQGFIARLVVVLLGFDSQGVWYGL
jgi:hypothetical protein